MKRAHARGQLRPSHGTYRGPLSVRHAPSIICGGREVPMFPFQEGRFHKRGAPNGTDDTGLRMTSETSARTNAMPAANERVLHDHMLFSPGEALKLVRIKDYNSIQASALYFLSIATVCIRGLPRASAQLDQVIILCHFCRQVNKTGQATLSPHGAPPSRRAWICCPPRLEMLR